jgi:ABC-type dipeptide/oligopeptide/nickel transport system permease subunit
VSLAESRGWRRFKKNRGATLGAIIVTCATVLSILSPLLAPHDPNHPYTRTALSTTSIPVGPSREFPLGADSLGRCELSRLLYGGRVSLSVAFAATALLAVVGTIIGIIAGYFGGIVDTMLMRVVDVLLSFPFLLVVMAINRAVHKPGIWVMFLVLGALSWTGLSRQVRAKVLQVKEFEFVMAARALGASAVRIMVRHILPNVGSLVIVLATTLVAEMIIVESVLSYLGVGVVPPTSSWGSMLQESDGLMRAVPRLTFMPMGAILVTVIGFNLLGEGLRDAFDPKT